MLNLGPSLLGPVKVEAGRGGTSTDTVDGLARDAARTTGGGSGCLLVLVVLLLGLVLFCAGGDLGILLGEDAYDSCGDLVVDDGFVVLAHNIDTEFLGDEVRWGRVTRKTGRTTISSLLSS